MLTFKDFVNDIDGTIRKQLQDIHDAIVEVSDKVFQLKYQADISTEILEKYGLNDDILIAVSYEGDLVLEYYYKGLLINPQCHYIRPEPYYEVDTLTILKECIKQDTHEPDIMALEKGEVS